MAMKAYACPRCLTLSAEMESGDGGVHTCTPTPFARGLELRVKELERLVTRSRSELRSVLADINADQIPHDGDDFHELLRDLDSALRTQN